MCIRDRVQPAVLLISNSEPFDFGEVANGGFSDHTFSIFNGGADTASGIAFSGFSGEFDFDTGAFPGSTGTCTTSLAAADTCTFVVRYTPSGIGIHTGSFTVSYFDGINPQSEVKNTLGEGLSPALLNLTDCLLYTSPSPRDRTRSRMPSSA